MVIKITKLSKRLTDGVRGVTRFTILITIFRRQGLEFLTKLNSVQIPSRPSKDFFALVGS